MFLDETISSLHIKLLIYPLQMYTCWVIITLVVTQADSHYNARLRY